MAIEDNGSLCGNLLAGINVFTSVLPKWKPLAPFLGMASTCVKNVMLTLVLFIAVSGGRALRETVYENGVGKKAWL